MINGIYIVYRLCEYYVKVVVYFYLNFKYIFKLMNSYDWCIFENMNNEYCFKEKLLVLFYI